jgi:hypothetical protein
MYGNRIGWMMRWRASLSFMIGACCCCCYNRKHHYRHDPNTSRVGFPGITRWPASTRSALRPFAPRTASAFASVAAMQCAASRTVAHGYSHPYYGIGAFAPLLRLLGACAQTHGQTRALAPTHTRAQSRTRACTGAIGSARPPGRAGGRAEGQARGRKRVLEYSHRAGGCGYSSARGRAGCATVRPGAGPVPMPCLQIDEAEAKRVAADGAERTHLR